ncbi:MAG: CPBP family intramembrane metalloprotease [Micromonosporaceae bacterium]|nr:CPBP family intramembrane metalloprotease [Micromonosporaceae bacterium]
MVPGYRYQPLRFFLAIYLVTWGTWFTAGYLSYSLPEQETWYLGLLLPGLVAPFTIALWMILRSRSPELKRNFLRRLFDPRLIRPATLIPMVGIMPAAVVISALLSVPLGGSLDQLRLAEGFSFSVGTVPVLLVLILAASFEELGWRSYAMDSLTSAFGYFKATAVFSVLWAGWHLPLFFIKDYYQNEITRENVLYGVNFMVSVIPIAFIISWLCARNRGSIPMAIGFHLFINLCQEALEITQLTKCIETGVLAIVAVVIVATNRPLFFGAAAHPGAAGDSSAQNSSPEWTSAQLA